MKRGFVSALIFTIIFCTTIISASSYFEEGNLSHLIETTYGASDYISGWINISLTDAPTNLLFKDSFDNNISLIDLLKTTQGTSNEFDYGCIPGSCDTAYKTTIFGTDPTFELGKNGKPESKLIGFEIKSPSLLNKISLLEFEIKSDARSDCYNQILVDFFDDGEIDFGNNISSDYPVCTEQTKTKGCFKESTSFLYPAIPPGANAFCQKIMLTQSPGFKIGAWIKIDGGIGNKNLTIKLRDLWGTSIDGGDCELDYKEITSEGGDIYCEVDYPVLKQEEVYVCVSYPEGTGGYKLRANTNLSENCGFYGMPSSPPSQLPGAYDIFVEGKGFETMVGNPIKVKISENKPIDLEGYLEGFYGEGIDCSEGCVIPVRFISKATLGQEIILEDLDIAYNLGIGPITDDTFYNLSETPATINAEFQKLYLDNGKFSVPIDSDDYTYSLKLGVKEIFSEDIYLGQTTVAHRITPTSTASAYPTTFKVNIGSGIEVNSSLDVTINTGAKKYVWDFGDSKTKTTTINEVVHTYTKTGIYNLKINITYLSGKETFENFEIIVKSPKDLIDEFLEKMQTDLENVIIQLNEFESFYEESLDSSLDFDYSVETFEDIKEDYESASESGYNIILTRLLALRIPEDVSISSSTDSLQFYPEEEDIDISILKEIGGGDYKESEIDNYIGAIYSWNQKNMDTTITFEEISATYDSINEPVLRIFQITAEKINDSENSYLILKDMENLNFKSDYSEEKVEDYQYVYLRDVKTAITFSTTEDFDFKNLPLFISPSINKLTIIDEVSGQKQKISKATLFVLVIVLLMIIGIVVYIILQEWYKKKYESYLFKNRNDLYNLVSYIQTAKKSGADKKKISSQLKKSGWNSEQVNYVMKKYAGKRTGMVELPVGKVLGKFNKRENSKLPQKKNFQRFPSKRRF